MRPSLFATAIAALLWRRRSWTDIAHSCKRVSVRRLLHRRRVRPSGQGRARRRHPVLGDGAPSHQTPPWAVTLIQWLREQHGLPAWAIGHALHIPRSTVSAWLRRLGLNRPALAPAVPIQR